MSIEDFIREREIKEVLHFTTNSGLVGILATKSVKSRKRLPSVKYLEHIYKPNCESRDRDAAWHDYVNLSITKINSRLFNISSGNWHQDLDGWWCIMSFRPEILTHRGVFFCTTNNMYSGVERQSGLEGLKALFVSQVIRWSGNVVTRAISIPKSQPTCYQAEVLYPGELSITYLQRIYVRDPEHSDGIAGMFGALSMPEVECQVRPGHFS